jgi:hypothetical protein
MTRGGRNGDKKTPPPLLAVADSVSTGTSLSSEVDRGNTRDAHKNASDLEDGFTIQEYRHVVIEVEPWPTEFCISAATPEDFLQQAFNLVVKFEGDDRGRALWASVSLRDRGRPKGSKYKDAMLLPIFRRMAQQMPDASATAIVMAVIDELELESRWGASRTATVKRLLRSYDEFFIRRGWKKKGRI